MSRLLLILAFAILPSTNVLAQSSAPDGRTVDSALRPAQTALAVAIKGIRAETRAKVTNLQVRLRTVKGQEQLDLMRQVQKIKTEGEIAVLETILADARLKQDDRRIQEAELALDNLRHPEKYRTATAASVPADR